MCFIYIYNFYELLVFWCLLGTGLICLSFLGCDEHGLKGSSLMKALTPVLEFPLFASCRRLIMTKQKSISDQSHPSKYYLYWNPWKTQKIITPSIIPHPIPSSCPSSRCSSVLKMGIPPLSGGVQVRLITAGEAEVAVARGGSGWSGGAAAVSGPKMEPLRQPRLLQAAMKKL